MKRAPGPGELTAACATMTNSPNETKTVEGGSVTVTWHGPTSFSRVTWNDGWHGQESRGDYISHASFYRDGSREGTIVFYQCRDGEVTWSETTISHATPPAGRRQGKVTT
ncbi:MAG: hypothetical protein ACRDQF_00635 [Thermocrispum sp.]